MDQQPPPLAEAPPHLANAFGNHEDELAAAGGAGGATTKQRQLKILVLGDSGVGKSCLLMRLAEGRFARSWVATIGIDIKIKYMTIGDTRVKLSIWDTAGQERLHSLTSGYYRGADGVLLVYDVTDMRSFMNVKLWISKLASLQPRSIPFVIVGNKCDLDQRRAISPEQGQELANQYHTQLLETSALNNTNVFSTFYTLAKEILDREARAQAAKQPPSATDGEHTPAPPAEPRNLVDIGSPASPTADCPC